MSSFASTVTQQYIFVGQNEAQAAVLDSLVQTAQGQLDLVNAKLKVGAGTIIDVRTAEVALGQAQVNALTAHNNAQVAKLRLYQTLGVPANINANLTTTFAISEPTFKLDELLDTGAARQSGSRGQEVARVREPDERARRTGAATSRR